MSASAQWWRVGPLKHKRYPALVHVKNYSYNKKKLLNAKVSSPALTAMVLIAPYNFNKTEAYVMKTAQRNMRYREYHTASYNFSDLAQIYIQQNRLSEAKWYLLQSTLISRRQNDFRHTYANLVCLAAVKMDMGDVSLARQDLLEARDIANAKGWIKESRDIEGKILAIKDLNSVITKYEFKYAEAAMPQEKSK
ncbi:hypothetical protein DJ568_11910 [Mucilaginibacter hurinus]|uniref:MalT-like TPR region domain-containing protein n=2 Tax=Mucilaginibacter hurinus TaxID=2201324 RepID=A0A367GPE2_9SPHI|nr:hypothetical protein DJ568_11910 [Mucilaginibacter hurinus]